jgi:hypothetical protein
MQNRCFKGDRCIFSHDMHHNQQVNTPQDGCCMSWIFGACDLPLCRFRHDVDMVKMLLLVRRMLPCKLCAALPSLLLIIAC